MDLILGQSNWMLHAYEYCGDLQNNELMELLRIFFQSVEYFTA